MAARHSAACQACRDIWSKISAISGIPLSRFFNLQRTKKCFTLAAMMSVDGAVSSAVGLSFA